MWPVEVKTLKVFPTVDEIIFGNPAAKPAAMVVPEWKTIQARPVAWHSHNWLCRQWLTARHEHAPAIRLFCDGPAQPLLELCARKGWYEMPVSTITKVAKAHDLTYSSGSTEFEQIFTITQSCFPDGSVSDEQVLDMLKSRFISLQPDEEALDVLMHCDDAQEILDKDDEKR